MKRPTVRDVAKLAGLSTASVHRAFNEPSAVRPETRENVRRAAAELGYRVNRQAIAFRTGRSNTVMVLVPDIANPFNADFFKGIEDEAWGSGYMTLIGGTTYDVTRESEYFEMLAAGKCDGIISHIGRFPNHVLETELYAPHGRSLVVSCNRDAGIDLPHVVIDDYGGAVQAAQHLLDLGHRRFAQIRGTTRYVEGDERSRGFSDTIRKALPRAQIVEVIGDNSIASGSRAVHELMGSSLPTAIFAHSDEMALGVIHELHNLGIAVPDQVSVVGFDDLNYASSRIPSLTTIRSPRSQWGATALRKLIAVMNGETVEAETVLPVELIARESSGPARN